jgi:hypothetical protein
MPSDNPTTHLIAVNINTGEHRRLAAAKDHRNAEACMNMAIMRRGVGTEFYKLLPHGNARSDLQLTLAEVPLHLTPTQPIRFVYRNGEMGTRTADAINAWFGSTEWHPEQQWFVKALAGPAISRVTPIELTKATCKG